MHFADKLIFPGGGLAGAPELPGWSPVTHDRSVIPVLHCVTSVALESDREGWPGGGMLCRIDFDFVLHCVTFVALDSILAKSSFSRVAAWRAPGLAGMGPCYAGSTLDFVLHCVTSVLSEDFGLRSFVRQPPDAILAIPVTS